MVLGGTGNYMNPYSNVGTENKANQSPKKSRQVNPFSIVRKTSLLVSPWTYKNWHFSGLPKRVYFFHAYELKMFFFRAFPTRFSEPS